MQYRASTFCSRRILALLCLLSAAFAWGATPTTRGQAPAGNDAASASGGGAQSPKPTPSPRRPSEFQKALEEFRIQMGPSTGGKAKVRPAGRQNSLTGRVYENLRNDLFDAVPHEVRQRGGTKSLLRRNQYGASLSGPIRLPKVYDGRGRTFFSFSFEATRERIAQSALFTVPTDRQRAGDFSDLVDTAGNPVLLYDPKTTRPNPNYDPSQPVSTGNLQYLRDPFPNNRIPENRIDPVTRSILALYPRANTNVGPFLQNNYWINSPYENRADGVIAKIDHALNARHQFSANTNFSNGLRRSPEYFPGPGNSGSPSYNFQSGSLSLQDAFTASPNVIWTVRGSASVSSTTEIGSADGQDHPRALGLQGVFSPYFPRLFFGSYLSIGPRNSGFRDRSYVYSGTVAVSINRKEHTWRATALARKIHANSFSPSYPSGLFSFGSSLTSLPGIVNTGNAFAQFLLGEVSRAEENVVLHPSYYSKDSIDLNVADTWRVRPGLTANLSLSLEVSTPRVEKYDRQSTVSLDRLHPITGRPGAVIFANRDGVGRGLQPATARLEPSLGVTFNPWNDRKTIVRTSYSLSYQEYPLYGRHFGTQGFNAAPIFVTPNDQLQSAFQLRQGMPIDFPLPPFLNPMAADGTEPDFVDPSGLLPSDQQWSLSVQRELPSSLLLEARYTGVRGTHQFVDGFIRLNAVPVRNLVYRDQLYNDAFRNSLRPYPQYRSFDLGGVYPGGDSAGHYLTMTLDQRLTGGLFGRASYTLGKRLDNFSSGSAQDPDNLRAEWALSTSDITHTLQLSYTYELPFGKGKRLFTNEDIFGRMLGGWSISALTTMRGGTPLQLRPLFNRSGGIVGNLRVNVVPGVDPQAETPTSEQWFNPAAFAQPDDFTLGNASRTHPDLRAPGEQFHHLSLTKRLELTADASLEFVTEAFNFPNHANLNDPDTRIGPESSPNLNAGRIIGSTGGRVMQLGLRILF
ncbi:MAG: hypothetical protein SF339_16115 [Blastocatellia bacterium]|nr:hypothetical protein [Blastocatellia bacterium]